MRLRDLAPEFERILTVGAASPSPFAASQIRLETVRVTMRDGIGLATDLYIPPAWPAPAIVARTPYGRARTSAAYMNFARNGYAVIAQDCRGTGESEPDHWDYYIYEREDSFDCIEWVLRQEWCDGFVAGSGGSYLAGTQWCMAMHPRMSTIAPEVGGLGVSPHTTRYYMFVNAYARSVGKGSEKIPVAFEVLERTMIAETLSGGYFNEPLHRPFAGTLLVRYPELGTLDVNEGKRWLWERYCQLEPAQRGELIKQALGRRDVAIDDVEGLSAVFGHAISHDAYMYACAGESELAQCLHAPALMITGWYDWFLDDALASWQLLVRSAPKRVSSRSRLLIAPSAHNRPGYHEGNQAHPELGRVYRTENIGDLLLRWYAAARGDMVEEWPRVIYYLMGANEWHTASAWPPPEARPMALYLGAGGTLTIHQPKNCAPAIYTYDPTEPTPTLGGSIVSYVYPPGSVDVSGVQDREDVLTYSTAPLDRDLDVVGSLRLTLYASSSAVDTDFSARLSDVFPDGRAIQLQSGILRSRYRNARGAPELLEPARIYRFEIDMWATANRFRAGHRVRLDISSADFPRFDRNSNRGGETGPPLRAMQTVFHDPQHPSCLFVSIMGPGVTLG